MLTLNTGQGEFLVEYTGEAIRPSVADVREQKYEDAGIGTYFWRLEEFLSNAEPPEVLFIPHTLKLAHAHSPPLI